MSFYTQYKNAVSPKIDMVISDPLEGLKSSYKNCSACGLCVSDKVFGSGAYSPMICVIGESPSMYDHESKRLFADKAGEKLKGMLSYVNRKLPLDNNVYYTNLVLCPSNVLGVKDADKCLGRLLEELEMVNPRYIVLLGEVVANHLLKVDWGIDALRLKKHVSELDKYYPMFVTHSLKELLYKNSDVKDKVKEELDYIIEEIQNERIIK